MVLNIVLGWKLFRFSIEKYSPKIISIFDPLKFRWKRWVNQRQINEWTRNKILVFKINFKGGVKIRTCLKGFKSDGKPRWKSAFNDSNELKFERNQMGSSEKSEICHSSP